MPVASLAARVVGQARTTLRRNERLRGGVVAAKDAAWQARVALGALRGGGIVVEDEYGIALYLPPGERDRLRSLMRRPGDRPAFALMDRLLGAGDVVFDVGANLGVYSVHAQRNVGPSGRVFAFEAVPATADRLAQTLALNGATDVQVVRAAVAETAGTATMHVFDDPACGWNSLGDHPMYGYDRGAVRPSSTVEVPAITLDGFADERHLDRVALCKIDVEGFERHVFAGASGLLAEHRIGVLCFEISEDALVGEGGTPAEVFAALDVHGYRTFRHDEPTDTLVGPIDLDAEQRRLATETQRPYVANYFSTAQPALLTASPA
ncbi:Methyltransferase, FkbM family [Frankia sp. AiPs1]|uniref:FkbM family methyltransferase n=1 Tax=Frankia sp. AiPa1 TaxID=573492 RepID=UPI00202B10F2|nr:FkbM family methyltransferase [Frankia sp. AiPa1]MCL9760148.1 FkbM family methyltransferase [Frankia sp. AiPa1]